MAVAASVVAGPVVAEWLLVDVLVLWRFPFFGALAASELGQAADRDVAAAGCLGGWAVAGFPGEVHQAGAPLMPEPALFWYDGQAYLCHARIQTYYRLTWKLLTCAFYCSTRPACRLSQAGRLRQRVFRAGHCLPGLPVLTEEPGVPVGAVQAARSPLRR